jgi:hypothetical protein
VLVAGAAFLLLCAAMFASDRSAARRTASVTGPQSPPDACGVPEPLPLRRDASATRPRQLHKLLDRCAEIIAHTLARVGLIGPFALCAMCSRDTAPRTLDSHGVLVRGGR